LYYIKGDKQVELRTTGHEKDRFTVHLLANAVFVVGVAPRGTFNTDTVIDWIRTSFRAVRQRLHATGHGVLALDSYGCHLHDDVSL
jgi:hypothetical protein